MSRTRTTVPQARPSLLGRAGTAMRAAMSAIGLGGGAPSSPHQGASVGRRLGGWRPTGSGPNAVVQASHDELVRRSRDMSRNNPHGKRAGSLTTTHAVGIGIKPRSLCSNAQASECLMELWAEWTDSSDADGVLDFYGQQALAVTEMFEGGECFGRLRSRRIGDGLAVPFQVQLIPTEQVPLHWSIPNGVNPVDQGIERNSIGQRVAYWMLQQHPGDTSSLPATDAMPRRVPAADVVHLYNIARVGQLRGLPWLAAAITTLHQIDAYFDAELERKRAVANVIGFIRKASSKEVDVEELASAWGEVLEELGGLPAAVAEPGTMQYLDLDEDVTFNQPADVGGNFQAFITAAYQKAAAAIDLIPEELTGDFAGGNDRTFRAKFNTFKRGIRRVQFHIICHQFNRPIWNRFVADALAFGALEARMKAKGMDWRAASRLALMDVARAEWRPERWEYINAKQDVEAVVAEIDAGLTSREAAVAERGDDIEVIDAQRANDKAREDLLGVPVVKKAAGAPAPAQEAPPAEAGSAASPFDVWMGGQDQPRGPDGRWISGGFKVGRLNVNVLRNLLGVNLNAGDAVVTKAVHMKLATKHRREYSQVRGNLKKCLSSPHYVGSHPRHPDNVDYVLMVKGLPGNAVAIQVPVSTIADRKGNYRVASGFAITQSRLDALVSAGHLTKVAK